MFDIIFWNDDHRKTQFVTLTTGCRTLEAAKEARTLSGDLAVYAGTFDVVKNTDWLWDWEKEHQDCYPRRMIRQYGK